MSEKYQISLLYEGEEYKNGEMNIKDFAPSLLAFGEIIEEVNQALNKEEVKIKTTISPDFKNNCFRCELFVNTTFLEKIKNSIGIAEPIKVETILSIAGFLQENAITIGGTASGSVIVSYITWLAISKRKKIKNETKLTNGNVEICLEDTETKIETTHQISFNLFCLIKYLYTNKKTKTKLNNAYKEHLKPSGYLKYEALQDNKKGEIKEDVKDVVLHNIQEQEQEIEKEEQMSSSVIEDILISLTHTSKDDCMWEFEDGETKKKCNMLDKEFFAKYKTKEIKLGGREKMRLQIRIDNFNTGKGSIRKEYSILKVLEIIEEKDLFNQ
jgi:hypothetical protein